MSTLLSAKKLATVGLAAIAAASLIAPTAVAAEKFVLTETFNETSNVCAFNMEGLPEWMDVQMPVEKDMNYTPAEARKDLDSGNYSQASLREWEQRLDTIEDAISQQVAQWKAQGYPEISINMAKLELEGSLQLSAVRFVVKDFLPTIRDGLQACADGRDYDSSKPAGLGGAPLEDGQIAGIVIGVIAGVLALIAAIGALTGMIPGIPKMI